jgi:hypothetical protein
MKSSDDNCVQRGDDFAGWMNEGCQRAASQPPKGMLGGTLNLFIVRLVRSLFVLLETNTHTRSFVRSPGESHCYICEANTGIHRRGRRFYHSVSWTELQFIVYIVQTKTAIIHAVLIARTRLRNERE